MESSEDRVPCEDFASCGAAQFQNRAYAKNIKQQDSYFVVEDIGATFGVQLGHAQRVSLYGVADGHGEFGEISAAFVRRNLPVQLAQSPHFAAGRLQEALHEAFAQTELLQRSAGLPLWASGACALAVAVSPTHIFVANCGDCRCVLAQNGAAQDLSNDHNIEGAVPEEIQRLLNAGATITPDKRVTVAGAPGRLATTRSLGDYWAKPQGPPENHIISGLPEIRVIPRSPGQQFLILASDGIYGFMSSQDVVTLCVNAAQQAAPSAPLSRIAHTVLCTSVYVRRSDDNCTAVVVDLARIEASTRQPLEARSQVQAPPRYPSPRPALPPANCRGDELAIIAPQTPPMPPAGYKLEDSQLVRIESPKSDVSLSSLVAPDEVCWCPWCWRQNRDGRPEKVILGSMERWRLHMHDQHFDKLSGAYGPDEVVACYWCCRPCVTTKGQSRSFNKLPFWGSHERVCKENPNKPAAPNQAARSTASSVISYRGGCNSGDDSVLGGVDQGSELLHEGSMAGHRRPPPPSSRSGTYRKQQDSHAGYLGDSPGVRGGVGRHRSHLEALEDEPGAFSYASSGFADPPFPPSPASSRYGSKSHGYGGRGNQSCGGAGRNGSRAISPTPARGGASSPMPSGRLPAAGRRAL